METSLDGCPDRGEFGKIFSEAPWKGFRVIFKTVLDWIRRSKVLPCREGVSGFPGKPPQKVHESCPECFPNASREALRTFSKTVRETFRRAPRMLCGSGNVPSTLVMTATQTLCSMLACSQGRRSKHIRQFVCRSVNDARICFLRMAARCWFGFWESYGPGTILKSQGHSNPWFAREFAAFVKNWRSSKTTGPTFKALSMFENIMLRSSIHREILEPACGDVYLWPELSQIKANLVPH